MINMALFELGTLTTMWLVSKWGERARSAGPDPWPDAWKQFAKRRCLELSTRTLEGEHDGMRVVLHVDFASDRWRRARNEQCARVRVDAMRPTKLDVRRSHAQVIDVDTLPERAREALADVRCTYEARSTAAAIAVTLTSPSFDDVERAMRAATLVALNEATRTVNAYR